jgi:predicted nucleic acid-binding protein
MNVISNSSPLIALSKINKLFIFRELFGKIHIPDIVYTETVLQSNDGLQKENILQAIRDNRIIVQSPVSNRSFNRAIDFGERAVFNLAFDKEADLLIIDDKKARKEAKELGFRIVKTSSLLKYAEKKQLISSYAEVDEALQKLRIFCLFSALVIQNQILSANRERFMTRKPRRPPAPTPTDHPVGAARPRISLMIAALPAV